ncbi:MAG: hypothetical protein AUJ70_02000 [Candidatus Omnitrophica bacterium CG1_02_40_15]|nr:MAG: hypothetical protein AUJ70_02000 [Candidatus Omnitrophica bacterium CG1_02_40_15]
MAYKITSKQIIRKEIDLAGKPRVWIEMPNGDLQMLKFQENPTIDMIQKEIDKIKESIKEELIAEIDRQIAELEERKKQLLAP